MMQENIIKGNAKIMGNNKKTDVKKLTVTAMLSAIAVVLMYMEIPVPLMPGFIKLDISDLPALFGSFVYGPLCGVVICLVKNIMHAFGSSTFFVGEISNFILGSAFVIPAGLLHKKMNNRKGMLTGSLSGAVLMAALSVISNYFFVYPIYYNFMSKSAVLKAYQAILPSVDSIFEALVVFNVPFTLVKGLICVVFAWILYIPLAPILRKDSK